MILWLVDIMDNPKKPSILVINEDVDLNNIITLALDPKKKDLSVLLDAEEGLSKIYSCKIDLIVLGKITFEGLSVSEILKRISSNPETMRLPVIVILPEKDKDLGVTALSLGAIDYLLNPINSIEFKIKIDNFISMKLLSESFEAQMKEEELKKQKIKELEMFKAFVVTANHEINQPLAIMKGNLDLFSMINPESIKGNEKYFDKINMSITKISKILNRLKEIEKPEFTGYTDSTVMIDIGDIS